MTRFSYPHRAGRWAPSLSTASVLFLLGGGLSACGDVGPPARLHSHFQEVWGGDHWKTLDPRPIRREEFSVVFHSRRLPLERSEKLDFGFVIDATFDGDSRVVVLDQLAREAVVITASPGGWPAGQEIRVLGQEGDGPGEFRIPSAVEILADGSIAVVDVGLWRIVEFGPNGEHRSTHSIPQAASFGQVDDVRVTSRREIWMLGYEKFQDALIAGLGTRARGVTEGLNTIQVLEDLSGSEPWWRDLKDVPGLQVFVDLGTGRIQDIPLSGRPLWAPDGTGGAWLSHSRDGFIIRLDRSGRVVCGCVVDGEPVPTNDAEARAFFDAEGVPEQRVERVRHDRSNLLFPDTHPLILDIVEADPSEVFVVWEGLVGGFPRHLGLYLDQACNPIHQVEFEPTIRPVRATRTSILAIQTDEFGQQDIVLMNRDRG